MTSALTKRFTPVRIQAVESGLFHERKQRERESVDSYAQALRGLFKKAYPSAQRQKQRAWGERFWLPSLPRACYQISSPRLLGVMVTWRPCWLRPDLKKQSCVTWLLKSKLRGIQVQHLRATVNQRSLSQLLIIRLDLREV